MNYGDFKKQVEEEKKSRELTAAFKRFVEDGDNIFGRLVSISTVIPATGGKEYNSYVFDTDAGLVKCSVGGATDKEWCGLITVGRIYSIVYHGKVDLKGGRHVNKFSLKWYPEKEDDVEPTENLPF
jgi:hypothetical protein